MTNTETDSTSIAFRCPKEIRDKLEAIAKEQRRTLSNLILLLLEEALKRCAK